MNKRLQSIDLLRGIAIILVMFCHSALGYVFLNMGWTGVDLFFVLSGFLVSGLLFSEYEKKGTIHARLFLIRRGFKIYPIFWLALLVLATIDLLMITVFANYSDSFSWCTSCYLHELLFVQNYLPGRAYITWSLAIEEHFYFILVLFIWLLCKRRLLDNSRLFIAICCSVFIICNCLRIWTISRGPTTGYPLSSATHLRLDSLLFGTLLSYLYHFSHVRLISWAHRYRNLIVLLVLIGLSVATWWSLSGYDEWLYTIGYSILYVSFGLLLLLLLSIPNSETVLKKRLTPVGLKFFSIIGNYSYSIYLFHIIIANIFMPFVKRFVTFPNIITEFLVYFVVSVFTGIMVSKAIEIPFLKMRDRYFPKREQKAP